MPPLPTDRPSLLRLANETERVLEEAATPDAPDYAENLYTLGRVRDRLGERKIAEKLLGQAADAYLKVDTPRARNYAMNAMVKQAASAAKDDRNEEALETMEHMIERFDGIPRFDGVPEWQPGALDLWMALLEKAKAKDHEGLYQATGGALDLLDPAGPTMERGVLVRTLVRRAESAQHLGYKDEAVETYEKAIEYSEGDDSDLTSEYLDRAIPEVAELLAELGRTDEATLAYARSMERFKNRKELWARLRRGAARLWLWSEK
jgi:tetratricopeptide (TPR) repeat protein